MILSEQMITSLHVLPVGKIVEPSLTATTRKMLDINQMLHFETRKKKVASYVGTWSVLWRRLPADRQLADHRWGCCDLSSRSPLSGSTTLLLSWAKLTLSLKHRIKLCLNLCTILLSFVLLQKTLPI
jgi:hypothetical protein